MKDREIQDLSDSELEVMKILWEKCEGTVRNVLDELNKKKVLSFNTVMTFMVRMHRKGYLSRRKVGGTYIYSPRVNKTKTLTKILDSVIGRVFDGALEPLVTYIAESKKLSSQQIQKLKEIVDESEKAKSRKGGDK